ncbi:MAG TPA: DUF928 domain-containing protein [Stellaceae bacterium]|nr:DUF928 domain-containing protein [Stellaceae bacterium]
MILKIGLALVVAGLAATASLTVAPAMAQQATAPSAAAADLPTYKPPLRGAPGGRVGGASRGATGGAPVSIELVSPDSHTGLTTNPSPTLYYFVSRPVAEPMKLTISAAMQPKPLIETAIPAPRGAGIQSVRLADYRVQLQPGISYAWSISVVVDPQSPSRDVVATATIMRTDASAASAAGGAQTPGRAGQLAQAGLWYDAVAAAADSAATDRHAAFDALLDQVGLRDAAAIDRQMAQNGR